MFQVVRFHQHKSNQVLKLLRDRRDAEAMAVELREKDPEGTYVVYTCSRAC